MISAVSVGVPAKVVKYRFDEETIAKLLKKMWWNGEKLCQQIVESNNQLTNFL